jgi:uncharacterized membrane protein YjjP (DUF1212 family)
VTEPAATGGDDATALLLDLGEALHAAAMPADLTEERLTRVAAALGVDAQFFALQSFFATELRRGSAENIEIRRIPFDTHWNLTQTMALVDLCRDLGDGKLDAAAGRRELARILAARDPYPRWLTAIAWGVYGGAVAVRVGGRWVEMLAAIVIGVVAGVIHFGTGASKVVNLEKTFLGAFAGSVVAFILAYLLPPFDYPRALFGGISLLVPAMVVTIGVHELANEELESGTVRLVYGLVCFALLGAGVVAAFTISDLVGLAPPHVTAHKLPDLVVLACVAVGGLALVVCLQARPRDVIWVVAAVIIAFGAQELTRMPVGQRGAPILAAFVLGVAGYLQARIPGHIAFTMIIPGLLQLAPGFMGTEATFAMLTAHKGESGGNYYGVVVLAVQLGIGILAASLIFRRRRPRTRAGLATRASAPARP